MSDIISWTATQTALALKERKISCLEVTQAHLQQLETENPAINAVVEVCAEEALQCASELDTQWQADNLPTMYGVPITTKINIDQRGSCTSNGLAALNVNKSQHDSPLIQNLRNDGAIILGRTNTPEFSMRWFTSNELHGVSLNPWNEKLTPGGSSGAAAAAVAKGIGCIAHGNDLGGSLRYPAYCCGVTSIKPSAGCVPAFNPDQKERPPLTQTMSVQGPIARSVADLKLALQSMSRFSSSDPSWSSASHSGRTRSNTDKPVYKVAYCIDAFNEGIHPDVAKAVTSAVRALRDAGHEVEEHEAPHIMQAATLWGEMLTTELDVMQKQAINNMASRETRGVLDAYRDFFQQFDSLSALMQGLQQRIIMQRAWGQLFDTYDAFLLPVSAMPPFANNQDFLQPDTISGMLQAQRFLYAINLLGLPSVALPTHVGSKNAPSGVQLVGAMHDDLHCLAIAAEIEAQLGSPIEQLQQAANAK